MKKYKYALMIDDVLLSQRGGKTVGFETFEKVKSYCEHCLETNKEYFFKKSFYIYERVGESDKFLYNNLFTHGIWVHDVNGEYLKIDCFADYYIEDPKTVRIATVNSAPTPWFTNKLKKYLKQQSENLSLESVSLSDGGEIELIVKYNNNLHSCKESCFSLITIEEFDKTLEKFIKEVLTIEQTSIDINY